jgi:hypothetical protein
MSRKVFKRLSILGEHTYVTDITDAVTGDTLDDIDCAICM